MVASLYRYSFEQFCIFSVRLWYCGTWGQRTLGGYKGISESQEPAFSFAGLHLKIRLGVVLAPWLQPWAGITGFWSCWWCPGKPWGFVFALWVPGETWHLLCKSAFAVSTPFIHLHSPNCLSHITDTAQCLKRRRDPVKGQAYQNS